MAFRFKLTETFPAGCRRIMREQIARAQTKLSADRNHETGIHETRKGMKRLRALLRLIRPSLSEQAYQRENIRYRDLSRLLSSAREQHVLLQTIASFQGADAPLCKAGFENLAKKISAIVADGKTQHTAKTVGRAVALLKEGHAAQEDISIKNSGFETVRAGFIKCHKKAKTTMAKFRSEEEMSDETAHEWRKSVQVHWRQMALLKEAWPEFMDHRIVLAKALSHDLGEDHDLAVLMTFVDAEVAMSITRQQADAIKNLVDARRKCLRQTAFAKGTLLFADNSKDLGLRVEQYWETHAKNIDLAAAQLQKNPAPSHRASFNGPYTPHLQKR